MRKEIDRAVSISIDDICDAATASTAMLELILRTTR
jgi:hypothetical protein